MTILRIFCGSPQGEQMAHSRVSLKIEYIVINRLNTFCIIAVTKTNVKDKLYYCVLLVRLRKNRRIMLD